MSVKIVVVLNNQEVEVFCNEHAIVKVINLNEDEQSIFNISKNDYDIHLTLENKLNDKTKICPNKDRIQ